MTWPTCWRRWATEAPLAAVGDPRHLRKRTARPAKGAPMILIVCNDTLGGVLPYARLGAALRAAGHAVTAAAPEEMTALFTDRNIPGILCPARPRRQRSPPGALPNWGPSPPCASCATVAGGDRGPADGDNGCGRRRAPDPGRDRRLRAGASRRPGARDCLSAGAPAPAGRAVPGLSRADAGDIAGLGGSAGPTAQPPGRGGAAGPLPTGGALTRARRSPLARPAACRPKGPPSMRFRVIWCRYRRHRAA